MMKEFGILLFGHTRPLFIADVLMSLEKQDALKYVNVWIDGHQGDKYIKIKTDQVYNVVKNFNVENIYKHQGNIGFRKMMLQALSVAIKQYDKIMILEDDCFPTRDAVHIFNEELDNIKNNSEIFSIYGHPFLMGEKNGICTRFQGWGWGTTSEKMKPILKQLIDCYSRTEFDYINYVNSVLTDDIIKRIDITPPRLPTKTLRNYFAWDETTSLLTALAGMVHKPTNPRTIYNFGVSTDSSRFYDISAFEKPPYNMVAHENIWDYF